MQTYIAFLRGINVGGHKKVPMQALRALLSKSFINVKTYIQTGNVIFKASEQDNAALEIQIKALLLETFEFEIPVVVKTVNEIESVLLQCPFSKAEKEQSYFTLLHATPLKKNIDEVNALSYPNEEFKIIHHCIYFYSSMGYGKVKLNNNFFEKKLKVSATTRNYRTLIKVLDLAKA